MNHQASIRTIPHADLPENDYVSPGFAIIMPDAAFPNMIVGDTSVPRWPYLRRWVEQTWYADRRNPDAGFVNRDEASILYNSALLFRGKPCLEVGCWRGWSAVHLALGAGGLDIIDPLLGNPDFAASVTASCAAAGVLDTVRLHPGASPEAIHALAQASGRRWSLIFIDADHEGDAPRRDAETARLYAADTAMVLFHDLASPHVAAGLDAMREAGWRTMVYQTMQIMGVAWRGNIQPVAHVPDPKVFWTLPRHLAGYAVSGWTPPALPADGAAWAGMTMEDRRNAAMLRAQAAEDDLAAVRAELAAAAARIRAAEATVAQRDEALARHNAVLAERNVAVALRDQVLMQRDTALAERTAAAAERDAVVAQRDQAVIQRDVTLALRDQALAQRDAAWEHRHDALRLRDAAIARADATGAGMARLGGQLAELTATIARRDEAEAARAFAARRDAALHRLAPWVLRRRVLLALLRRAPEQRIAIIRGQTAAMGAAEVATDPFVHWLCRRRTLLGLLRRSARQGEAAMLGGFQAALHQHAPSGAEAAPAGAAGWLDRWFAAGHAAAAGRRSGPALARYVQRLGIGAAGADAWVTLLTTECSSAARRTLLGALAAELADTHEVATLAARVRGSALFDEAFYRDRAGLAEPEADAALHYLLLGEPLGLAPSAAFDPAYYARRYGDIAETGANGLLHYDTAGRGEGRQPLPAGAARAQAPDAQALATAAWLERWRAGMTATEAAARQPMLPGPVLARHADALGFGPAFAEAWAALLAADAAGLSGERRAALAAGLRDNGELAALAARVRGSALFDAAFYRDRAGLAETNLAETDLAETNLAEPEADAALHYLLLGEPLGFAPSAAFDPAYYRRRYPDVVEAGSNALLHYDAAGRAEGRQPLPAGEAHPPAAPAPDGTTLPAVALLDHWLAGAARAAERRQLAVSGPLLQRYFARLGFSPAAAAAWAAVLTTENPAAAQRDAAAWGAQDNTDLPSLAERVRRCPVFDEPAYRRAAGLDGTDLDAALHYLLLGEPLGRAPSAAFDPHYYACRNSDIFEAGVNCLLHYAAAGHGERRQPLPPSGLYANPALLDPARDNVIVAVHEASRTGSPILGWNIVRLLAQRYNIYMIRLDEGPLTPEFEALSVEVHGPFTGSNRHPVDMEFGLRRLFAGRAFKYAIVNSIESRRLVEICARRAVPTVLLMHEFGSYVRPLGSLRTALDLATEIVFPAPIVARSTTEAHPPLLDRPVRIQPQGMSIIPSGNTKRKLPPRKQMQALAEARAAGAFIVIGAGSVIIRKGVDLFITIAADLRRLALTRPVHFLWIGHGYRPNEDMGYSVYLKEQLERSGLQEDITFMDEVSDLDPIYDLAHAFLLTSRLDPLPNVSIDAAFRSIPTICFRDASGTADLLLADPETATGVVPHLDTAAAAELIGRLAADEPARLRLAEATGRLARTVFDMQAYVARLDALGTATAALSDRNRADAKTLRADDSFDQGLFLGPDWPVVGRDEAIAQYLALADSRRQGSPHAAAAPVRRPMAGFHPWAWTAAHPAPAGGPADPLADFIRHGCPPGPWLLPVLRPETAAVASSADGMRALLHAHLDDPELAPELLAGLEANKSACDLLVTTDDDAKAARLREALAGYRRGAATVLVVPPCDGDSLRPLLANLPTAGAAYDIVGHIHDGLATPESNARHVHWQNMVGGHYAMRDRILAAFSQHADLGVVFPADPYLAGWGKSRPYAERLAARLGLGQPMPEAFDFPTGAMFWMRTALLQVLLPLSPGVAGDDDNDDDNAWQAAFVRIIPFAAQAAGLSQAVTHVPGVTW